MEDDRFITIIVRIIDRSFQINTTFFAFFCCLSIINDESGILFRIYFFLESISNGLSLGICWDRAGMAKAEMMKGHSRMYANRLAAIPKGADPWKY